MIRGATRYFSHFPWNFNKELQLDLVPISATHVDHLKSLENGFVQSYRALINAIWLDDHEAIKDFTGNSLQNTLLDALNKVFEDDYGMAIANSSAKDEIQVSFFNERVVIHAPETLEQPILYVLQKFNWFGKIMNIIDQKSVKFERSDEYKLTYKLDVVFESKFKLIMIDSVLGCLIKGEDDSKTERHVLEFEIIKKLQPLFNVGEVGMVTQAIGFLTGDFFFNDEPWVITDMDNFIKKPY